VLNREVFAVVGGSGFIGTRVVDLLIGKYGKKVYIVDKRPSQAFPDLARVADVRSFSALRDTISSDSVIVNLAAEHRDDVSPADLYYQVNVDGARNLCSIAESKGVKKIIFTSSVAVYGHSESVIDEDYSLAPFNHYGRSKLEAEKVFLEWYRKDPDNRTLVIVRPTVVFGRGNRGNVFNLLKSIVDRKFVMVGSGRNKKSIAYVENVAAFIVHVIDSPPGKYVYNYADKPDYSMTELVEFVSACLGTRGRGWFRVPLSVGLVIGYGFDVLQRITGRQFDISSVRIRKFCSQSVFSSRVSSTGFVPPCEINAALEQTIRCEFIESRLSAEGDDRSSFR
jgi:nucleoside-diphosphate-sugar epimerase